MTEWDGTVLDAFEAWWSLFPRTRRVGKGAARKKFAAVVKSGEATAEQMVQAVQEGRGILPHPYEPMPVTWLNQGRWEDDPPEQTTGNGLVDDLERVLQ